MEELLENKIVENLDEIKAIGHRIVQGGPYFDKTEEMTDENIKKVKELSDELGNLQKFDDLNVVDFPKDSGSSGGGGGGGAGAGGIEPLKLPDIDTSPIDTIFPFSVTSTS